MSSRINTFVLHQIIEKSSKNWEDVEVKFFKKMIGLALEKYSTISSFKNLNPSDKEALVLTFDDGFQSDYHFVFPILKELNLTATFFISPSLIGKKDYMTWEQVQVLSNSGMEIGSHSQNHLFMSRLSDKELKYEFEKSKSSIEEKICKEIFSFAYPYGDFSKRTNISAREAGYENVFTSVPGISYINDNFYKRNAIHSSITSPLIKDMLNPGKVYLYRKKLKYSFLLFLKETIGINNYLKLKKLVSEL